MPAPSRLRRARRPVGGSFQQQAPAPAPAAGPMAADPYDYNADPILLRIRAGGQQAIADAEARAINQRRQAELDYGDTRARLDREGVERPRALTESLNQGNLFYSTEFGRRQTDLARGLLEDRQGAERAHGARLAGIEDDLAGVRRGVADADLEAEEGAAGRLRDRLGDLPVRPRQSPVQRALGRGVQQVGWRPRPTRPGGRPGGRPY